MATSAQLRKQILQGSWDAALAALYGADPAVLQRQRGRYAAALEQFELYFGPGRQVHVMHLAQLHLRCHLERYIQQFSRELLTEQRTMSLL